MTITLERLTHADINLLRELRNASADAFFDDTYITREMQEDWWWRYELRGTTKFYTIWLNKVTPVGFLSVHIIGSVFYGEGDDNISIAEIGHLLLAPAFRHRGIMHAALTEVRRLYDPLTFWVAHVKPTNMASLSLFERQGFIPVSKKGDCVWGSSLKNTKPSSPICSLSSKARSSRTR